MAIQSGDQLIASITAGCTARYDWNKIVGAAAYAAGRWYDFSLLSSSPVANTFPGTALGWVGCSETTGNGTQIFGIPHGGSVSPNKKHLLNMAAWTTVATGAPGTLMLVDIQGYYPGISLSSAATQTLTGTPSLRYTNGEGLRAYLVVTTASGATAHNLSMTYTDQAGNTGNTLPVTVSGTASAIQGHLTHSGTAANNYGPFLPLTSGDTGIRSVQDVKLSASSGAGTAALVLCRPLAQITLSVAGLMVEKDLLNQIPSLPEIKDGACLTWLYAAGAATGANTTFAGSLEFVHG